MLAVEFASMALEIDSQNKKMTTIKVNAEQKIKDEAAAARAAAAATRARRIEESKKITKKLGKVQVAIREGFRKLKPGPVVEITDAGLLGALKARYHIDATGKPEDFAWFCDFWHENPISSLDGQFWGTYKARFADQSDWEFLTEDERDRFVELVKRATADWNERYQDVREAYKCGNK